MNPHSEIRVGMTYDLKSDYLAKGYTEEEAAEFDSPETIKAIENVLLQMGFEVERIGNIHALVDRLAEGRRWDFVFNICEGAWGSAREAQVPCLLDAYQIPYVFSESSVLSLALNKALTKEVIRSHGIPTPQSFVLRDFSDIDAHSLEFPLFLKPASEGSSKGIHADCKVLNLLDLQRTARRLFNQGIASILVETYLPGREFTVGIRGAGVEAQVLGVMELGFENKNRPDIYCYETKRDYLDSIRYQLADENVSRAVADVALRAWKALECRDLGRIDVRLDEEGVPHFMEVNPLPGLHPHHSDLVIMGRLLGVSYFELVSNIVYEAFPQLMNADTEAAV